MGLVWLVGLVGILAVVLGRCWQLQYCEVDSSRERAARQQRKIIPQTARRGSIVDREGRALAESEPVFSVAADPCVVMKAAIDPCGIAAVERTASVLAKVLSQDKGQLLTELRENKTRRFLWIKRHISDEEAKALRAEPLAGVILQRDYVRRYPMGELGAHVVGYTCADGSGLEGIEKTCDEYLSGRPGKLLVRMDVRRRALDWMNESESGCDGLTVSLTLDAVIQEAVEQELQKVVKKFHAASAVAVVMESHSGEIYALANYPGFEPTAAHEVEAALRRNRVLTDPVEPGSTFKPFTVAAALEGGFVTVNEKIFCHDGSYRGKGIGTITEYGNHSYGKLTVAEIIMHSSNIGSAIIAQKMGKKHFYQMIERFGYGRKTGIDLIGESPGLLTPLSEWKWGQYALTRAAYGQGPVAVTPLQLIRGFCCFANGGRLVRPRIVRGVVAEDGSVIRDFGVDEVTRPLRVAGNDVHDEQVISAEVARTMVQDVLVAVVERPGGTAHNAYLEGYRVFGKTGTAQVAKKGQRGYEENKYIASFIAGAPAEDPRICVLVMVREPDRSLGLGYTGGMVAAPAVREIIQQSLAYLGVPPRPRELVSLPGQHAY